MGESHNEESWCMYQGFSFLVFVYTPKPLIWIVYELIGYKFLLSWLGCWIAYCQVVLAFFPSARAMELLKYLDLIVRTHSSFPSADVWLWYDRGFCRKAGCSPVPLDWGATDLEAFHQAYASSNVLQQPPSSLPPFWRSADTLRPGEAHGSPSGS